MRSLRNHARRGELTATPRMPSMGSRRQDVRSESGRIRIAMAAERDRETLYRMRHAVYATELRQHPENAAGQLRDALDDFNEYILAWRDGEIAGFVSVTPPGHGRYS